MSGRRSLLRNRSGAAAAEMALVAPMLITLMFGSVELGRFFWNEHQLVKAVRNASVYASRQRVIPANYDCATNSVGSDVSTPVTNLVRTGVLAGGTDRMDHWDAGGASVAVTLTCTTAAGGTNLGGLYTINGNQVPIVTVTATLPFPLLLTGLGLTGSWTLQAKAQSAVVGI